MSSEIERARELLRKLESDEKREPTRDEMKGMTQEEIRHTTEARKYLKTNERETKEERETRKKNVKKMLKDVIDSQVGVTDSTVNNAFKEGAGSSE